MRIIALVFVIGTVVGCGGAPARPGPPEFKITGQVKYGADPLADGRIEFYPTAGKGSPTGGKITKGSYKCLVMAGKYDVRITAEKVVGRQKEERDPKGERDIVEQYIPKEYNEKTTLKCEVSTDATQDFTLTPADSAAKK